MTREVNSKFLMPYIDTRCPYCHNLMTDSGRRMPTRDHFLPASKGHGFQNNNRVICCEKCNNSKGNKHPIVWWYGLRAGNDYRAPIVFAFIVDRDQKHSRHHGIKEKALIAFCDALREWTRPAITINDHTRNIVARIGADEVGCSLSATWN